MQTYGEIAERVRQIVLSPSSFVSAEIPTLVHKAQLEAERRHVFRAMEGYTVARAGTTIRSRPLGGVFLRRRLDEEPFFYRLTVANTFGAGAGTVLLNAVRGDALIRVTLDPSAPAFAVGDWLSLPITGTGLSIPAVYRALEVAGSVLTLDADDSAVADGASIGIASTATLQRWTAERLELEWAEAEAMNRMFGTDGGTPARPTYVVESTYAISSNTTLQIQQDVHERRFAVYPRPDPAFLEYHYYLPAVLSLSNRGLLEPPDPTTRSWWTGEGAHYLAYKAAAEAYLLEHDEPRYAFWNAKADHDDRRNPGELQKLMREDQRRRVRVEDLFFSADGRAVPPLRTPRF